MDIEPGKTKPISDDQELAKALAGVSQSSDDINFEETPVDITTTVVDNAAITAAELPDNNPAPEITAEPTTYNPQSAEALPAPNSDDDLDSIKQSALTELRPLVDKLDLSPEEKFDTYLLLIRSTDDRTLIAPAYDAAKNIPDETRRAQALLDVIKEIDFFSTPQQPAA